MQAAGFVTSVDGVGGDGTLGTLHSQPENHMDYVQIFNYKSAKKRP